MAMRLSYHDNGEF